LSSASPPEHVQVHAALHDISAAACDTGSSAKGGIFAMTADDIVAHAQELLDANGFLTLGTVDPSGRP
jgi:hypothetical protein